MTLGQKMRRDNRIKNLKEFGHVIAIGFCAFVLAPVMLLVFMWTFSWIACVLSTVCYNANI